MSDGPLYLYAVCRAGRSGPVVEAGPVEPSGEPVGFLEHGDLGVVASSVDSLTVRMTPANLEAHQRVVEEAARSGSVLPFRFGLVARSEDELVTQFLEPKAPSLRSSLDALEGLVEVRVVARYREDVALRDVVRSDASVRRLQAQVRRRSAAAGYFDRIALGERIVAALAQVRERDMAFFGSRLRPLVRAESRLTGGDEEDGFRLAYLIAKGRLERFDEALALLGREQHERMEITLLGPLAPWDFAEAGTEMQWAS